MVFRYFRNFCCVVAGWPSRLRVHWQDFGGMELPISIPSRIINGAKPLCLRGLGTFSLMFQLLTRVLSILRLQPHLRILPSSPDILDTHLQARCGGWQALPKSIGCIWLWLHAGKLPQDELRRYLYVTNATLHVTVLPFRIGRLLSS